MHTGRCLQNQTHGPARPGPGTTVAGHPQGLTAGHWADGAQPQTGRVVSALCADSFEPQARRYNRIPNATFAGCPDKSSERGSTALRISHYQDFPVMCSEILWPKKFQPPSGTWFFTKCAPRNQSTRNWTS